MKWKPKSWRTPKTRWTRPYTPGPMLGFVRALLAAMVSGERLDWPKWADVALKYGWLSRSQYCAIPDSEKVLVQLPKLSDMVYTKSQFAALLAMRPQFQRLSGPVVVDAMEEKR